MKNNKKYMTELIISIILLIAIILTITYAYFRKSNSQSAQNNITTLTCLSMSFVDKTAAINLVNDFPVTDADGLKNEPFTFTVTNNCNKLVALGLGVESLTTSTIDSSHIKASIVSEGATPTTGSILTSNPTGNPLNGGTAYIVLNDYLNINQSKSYDLRLWLDYNTTAAEASGKVYNGKAIVTETAVNNTL